MADHNGVKSPNVTASATLDTVLGSKGGSTRAQTVDNLARQMLASGPIRAALPTSGSNALYFATREEMEGADITLPPEQSVLLSAWVYADETVENNGIYRYIPGTPASWERVLDLPMQWALAEHAEGSTGDAILAATPLPVARSLLIALPIAALNEDVATVSFNGGDPLTIVSNSGLPIFPGGLIPPMKVWGTADYDAGTFQLINDQVASAIVALAEAAAASAVLARNGAVEARDLADRFANAPEDEEVTPGSGLFSAFHYMKKASALVLGGIAAAILGAPEKAAPADDDYFGLVDSEDDNALKKTKISTLVEKVAERVELPVGTVIMRPFDHTFVAPGFLLMNDAGVTPTYPVLRAMGIAAGWELDGEGNPKIPPMGGIFPRGWLPGQLIDSGRVFNELQEDALQNITGNLSGILNNPGGSQAGGALASDTPANANLTGGGNVRATNNVTFDASRVARTSDETRPINRAFTYWIKAYSTATDPGEIDLANVANDINAHDVRLQELEGRVLFYESAEIAIVVGGTTVLTHGLGGAPSEVDVFLRCKTAELTFVPGDEIRWHGIQTSANTQRNFQTLASNTSITLQVGNNASPLIVLTPTGGNAGLVVANWAVVVRAKRWLN